MVSHDKEFLNAVATDIIHFINKTLVYYPGNFATYLQVREDKKKKKMLLQSNMDKKRAHMEASIDKMKKAALSNKKDHKRLGQVASRKKKLERFGMVLQIIPRANLVFRTGKDREREEVELPKPRLPHRF